MAGEPVPQASSEEAAAALADNAKEAPEPEAAKPLAPDAELLKKLAEESRKIYAVQDLPPIYPWMLRQNLLRADWLGQRYRDKTLYEPINIIIRDSSADSGKEAEEQLMSACRHAKFLYRFGHSSDYLAVIDGQAVSPFPGRRRYSFSDRPFETNNNHGRIFGPVLYRGKYYFVGAFSREKVRVAPPVTHKYVSFNQARDAFAWSLDWGGYYKITGFVPLGNAIAASTQAWTGDHDGTAILLDAIDK